ncbi:MAG TPA: TIGR03435 family protein [Bryobacteraceae bacterium]|nr:TIGR03435 family protein [Bryobacteraceae bacterium]
MNINARSLLAALFLAALAVPGQNAQRPEFEVATIRQSLPDAILDSFVPTLNVAPGTTLRIVNRQLKEVIMIAYHVGGRQLVGPQWLIDPPGRAGDIPRFDIVAKVPDDAAREQIPVMLQNLLADQFQLRVHHEQQQIVIYALELAKGGIKLKPLSEGGQRSSGCIRNMFGANGVTTAVCQNMTPAQLAQQLQTLAPGYFREGPVVDKTSLTQVHDFTLEWITQQQREAGEEGPSMFDAIEKLGLHLERQKGTADVLLVDQARQRF